MGGMEGVAIRFKSYHCYQCDSKVNSNAGAVIRFKSYHCYQCDSNTNSNEGAAIRFKSYHCYQCDSNVNSNDIYEVLKLNNRTPLPVVKTCVMTNMIIIHRHKLKQRSKTHPRTKGHGNEKRRNRLLGNTLIFSA